MKHRIKYRASYFRYDAPILNDKFFPKDTYGSLGNIVDTEDPEGFKYPHLQLRNVSYSVRKGRKEERILDMINIEARGGELVAILASNSEYSLGNTTKKPICQINMSKRKVNIVGGNSVTAVFIALLYSGFHKLHP